MVAAEVFFPLERHAEAQCLETVVALRGIVATLLRKLIYSTI